MPPGLCIPDLQHETRFWQAGFRFVAGLDEVGRGAWAGPVVAGAVILPCPDDACRQGLDLTRRLEGVRDSKQLTAASREALARAIRECAVAWSVGAVEAQEIDAVGIVPSTRRAMALALEQLSPPAEALLIDHLSLPELVLPQRSLPKGDALVLSIAAASIVAKVYRDALMVAMDAQYPGYGFGLHKGYGTASHRTALASLGPSPIHRLSFAPLARTRETAEDTESAEKAGTELMTAVENA